MKTIKLVCNAIISGKWFSAGDPIDREIVPASLRKYEAREEEPATGDPANLMREANRPYPVDADDDDDGFTTPTVRRQVARMQAEAERDDLIEEELNAPVSESIAEAIKEAQEDYHADVQQQIANAKYRANRSDAIDDGLREEADAKADNGEFDEFDREERKPKLRVPSFKLFVQRAEKYVLALNVRLMSGEKLYRHRKSSFWR